MCSGSGSSMVISLERSAVLLVENEGLDEDAIGSWMAGRRDLNCNDEGSLAALTVPRNLI